MRIVIQRVKEAKVIIHRDTVGEISAGMVVLFAAEKNDTENDLNYLVDKTINLRIFEDNEGKMNLSLLDIKGEILIVSQFTLLADCRRGRRPSFDDAAPPLEGEIWYNKYVEKIKGLGLKVQTGRFGAKMLVEIKNDGPVTIILDSKKLI
ncbi:MAG: D-aminoacyl-tRNA deacylase [Candidatus Hydrogenedentota bacterium]